MLKRFDYAQRGFTFQTRVQKYIKEGAQISKKPFDSGLGLPPRGVGHAPPEICVEMRIK